MIIGIEAKNFRGWTGKHKLIGFDIFLGANRIGKTSRINAVHFGIFGRIPGYSKKEPELYGEIGGAEDGTVSVTLKLDHHLVRQIDRALVKREGEVYTKLSIEYTDNAPPEYLDADTLTKQESNLMTALRPSAESFNLDSFRLDLSGPDRERTLLRLAGGSPEDNEEYRDVLLTMLGESKAGKKAIREKITPEVMEVWHEGGAWNTGILAIERKLMDMKNSLQTESREAKKAVQKIGGDEDPQGSLPEIEDKLKAERSRKAELDTQVGEESLRVKGFTSWEKERDNIQKRITGYTDDEGEIHLSYQDQIDEIKAELKGCSDKTVAKFELAIESQKTDRDVALAGLEEIRLKMEPIEKKRDSLLDPKQRAGFKLEALDAVLLELEDNKDGTPEITCPLILEVCTGDITRKKIQDIRNETAKDYGRLETEVDDLERLLGKYVTMEEAHEKDEQLLNESIKDDEADLRAKQNRKPEIEANLETTKNQFVEAKKRLKELDESKPPLADTDRDTLDDEITGIDETIEALEKQQKAVLRVQEQDRQRLKLQKRVDEIASELTVVNAYMKLTNACMEQFKEQVRGRITEYLSALREYWSRKTECPLPTIEFRAKDFYVDGIRFNSISGAERIMAELSIALGFILMRKAGIKILMIDDVQIIDPKNWKIIGDMLMKALKAGDIDNVLVAGYSCSEPKGSKTWNLDSKT